MTTVASKGPLPWNQLKVIVQYSRKLISSINNDVPTSIKFREYQNPHSQETEYRVYFLANNQKREVTIKYVTVKLNSNYDNKLVGTTIFQSDNIQSPNDKKLTKEEQLLRERRRCAFSGITQYALDSDSGRFVFSERSELFCFDDKISQLVNELLYL